MGTKKIAYVEQRTYEQYNYSTGRYEKTRDWLSGFCHDIAEGLTELGYEVKGFLFSELDKLPITIHTPVRGNIRTVRKAFSLLKVPQPENLTIPKSIRKFANRKVWETTLGKVRKSKTAIFAKSLKFQKLFPGTIVMEKDWDNSKKMVESDYTKKYPDNLPLLASEVVEFEEEMRFYVLDKKIVGIGDCYCDPSKEELQVVKKTIEAYKDAPVAYAIDFGSFITEKGVEKFGVVEVNQAFSAALYGGRLTPSKLDYTKMFLARWNEIVGLPYNQLTRGIKEIKVT